jgi:hypothetical protein
MNKDDLLDSLREVEYDLYEPSFRDWVAKQSDQDKIKIRKLRTELINYRSGLETNQLKVLADKLDELAPEIEKGIDYLQKVIKALKDFTAALNTLGSIIGLVSRVVTLIA